MRGNGKIRRGANRPLNGLGGSKHRVKEKKLTRSRRPIILLLSLGPFLVLDIRISCSKYSTPDENNNLISWRSVRTERLVRIALMARISWRVSFEPYLGA